MAHDVFLSWADPEDREVAGWFAHGLESAGFRVYWSRRIRPGTDWLKVVRGKLDAVPCLVVLWSRTSVHSTWVRSEAGEAAERGVLVPVLVDRVRPPVLFRGYQALDLSRWRGGVRNPEFKRLADTVRSRVDAATEFHEWFTQVPAGEPIGDDDLTLVDSTWIVPPTSDETYHVHVILHADPSVLDRVERVVYYLEGWRNGEYRTSTDRARHFELHEHAWSHFVVRAEVTFADAPAVVLRRFVHLTPEGPSLEPFLS